MRRATWSGPAGLVLVVRRHSAGRVIKCQERAFTGLCWGNNRDRRAEQMPRNSSLEFTYRSMASACTICGFPLSLSQFRGCRSPAASYLVRLRPPSDSIEARRKGLMKPMSLKRVGATRGWAALVVLAFVVSALGCGGKARSARPRDGTARMAHTLAVIYAQALANPESNRFLNRERADKLQMQLAQYTGGDPGIKRYELARSARMLDRPPVPFRR
jgi:hypothetical protein